MLGIESIANDLPPQRSASSIPPKDHRRIITPVPRFHTARVRIGIARFQSMRRSESGQQRTANPIGGKDCHRGTAMRPTRQRLLVCLLRCIAPFSKIVLRLTIFPWLWGLKCRSSRSRSPRWTSLARAKSFARWSPSKGSQAMMPRSLQGQLPKASRRAVDKVWRLPRIGAMTIGGKLPRTKLSIPDVAEVLSGQTQHAWRSATA